MNRSPTRHKFSTKRHQEKLKENPDDENALLMIEYYNEFEEKDRKLSEDLEWRKDNLEYDLRTTDWIIEKAKSDDAYAQHLYAAMCNNEFMKNDVWPILTEKKWSCSWRHAGGIIADMRETGDYMDWYCSGIQNDDPIDDEVFQNMDDHQKQDFFKTKSYVPECTVTEEIREDLFKLGWIVIAGMFE
jgi:hypothetical protein